jgi:hypothetical protein
VLMQGQGRDRSCPFSVLGFSLRSEGCRVFPLHFSSSCGEDFVIVTVEFMRLVVDIYYRP